MSRKHNAQLDENGFASIVIALIFIVVLALMTVGFAQLARREQQTALDKQLSTQANYAAESGINAAFNDIENGKITPTTPKVNTQQCVPPLADSTAATHTHNVDSTNGVTYSCLLVALQTPNIVSGGLTPGTGRHMNFSTQDNLSGLTVYWGSDSGHNSNFPDISKQFLPLASSSLPSWSSSKYPPVVELSLTPTTDLSSQSNPTQYLTDNTTNVYLYPALSGSGINSCSTTTSDPSACSQGQILSGYCDTGALRSGPNQPDAATYPCSATLTGLGDKNYVIRYVDFYDTSNIWIDGTIGGVAPPPIASITQDGKDYTSCVPYPPGNLSCINEGNSVYNPDEYDAKYALTGLPAKSSYNLTLNYQNFNAPGWPWPPPADLPYKFDVEIDVNGVQRGSDLQLSTTSSSDTVNLGALPANPTVDIIWKNNGYGGVNGFIPYNGNPQAYDPNFEINSFTVSEPTPPSNPLAEAQFTGEPQIDVTGKARNVLKRLQARLFINGGGTNDNDLLPNGAVEAQNLCKRIQAAPSTTDYPAGSSYDTGTSPSCDLSAD